MVRTFDSLGRGTWHSPIREQGEAFWLLYQKREAMQSTNVCQDVENEMSRLPTCLACVKVLSGWLGMAGYISGIWSRSPHVFGINKMFVHLQSSPGLSVSAGL